MNNMSMEQIFLPILIASTIGLMAYGLIQLFGGLNDQKRKLQQRLGQDGRVSEGFDPETFTVVKREQEVVGMSGVLVKWMPASRKMAQRIIQVWPSFSLALFAAVTFGAGLFGFIVVTLVTDSYFLGSIGGLVTFFIPLLVLNTAHGRRERTLLEQLPEALDFLSRILRAGHSLSTGLQMMAEELPMPLALEFRKCYDAHSVGQSMEEALKDAAVRVDNSDFGFFVTATLIQRQTGGDLSEVLNNISDMIRQRIRLSQHVKAKTAEGRFTGYILVVFPVVMFCISYYLNPGYAKVLLHTTKGIYLICTAVGMLILGTWAIRKVTTIKV
jgi:tight adherence protein B